MLLVKTLSEKDNERREDVSLDRKDKGSSIKETNRKRNKDIKIEKICDIV